MTLRYCPVAVAGKRAGTAATRITRLLLFIAEGDGAAAALTAAGADWAEAAGSVVTASAGRGSGACTGAMETAAIGSACTGAMETAAIGSACTGAMETAAIGSAGTGGREIAAPDAGEATSGGNDTTTMLSAGWEASMCGTGAAPIAASTLTTGFSATRVLKPSPGSAAALATELPGFSRSRSLLE